MIPGYLVKAAGNGYVVIQEKYLQTQQGVMTQYIVDNECCWVFAGFEEMVVWLNQRFNVHRGTGAQVVEMGKQT